MIRVKVRLFGVFRQQAGRQSAEVELEEGATAAMVLTALRLPDRPDTWLLVNGAPRGWDQVLFNDDEISIFQPVGGG